MRIEVRPGFLGMWTTWSHNGDKVFGGSMLNAVRIGIEHARRNRCELWMFEGKPFDDGEHGTCVADFGSDV